MAMTFFTSAITSGPMPSPGSSKSRWAVMERTRTIVDAVDARGLLRAGVKLGKTAGSDPRLPCARGAMLLSPHDEQDQRGKLLRRLPARPGHRARDPAHGDGRDRKST